MERKQKIIQCVGAHEIPFLRKKGGSMNMLSHFIGVDKRKACLYSSDKGVVVLAIRGTFTISELKSNLKCSSVDFCNGFAHQGISECTLTLWDHAKKTIVDKIIENPGFDSVITGHSLGAGAASLLTLKLKYEDILLTKENKALKDVAIRCFAFASPPVFYLSQPSKKSEDAMNDTYAFIHEKDVVPFCSGDKMRKLTETTKIVDEKPKGFLFSSPLMAAGLKPISKEIVDEITKVRETTYAKRTHRLAIAAPFVMWMRKDKKDERGRDVFDVRLVDQKKKKVTLTRMTSICNYC